jgi:hypothetical protein
MFSLFSLIQWADLRKLAWTVDNLATCSFCPRHICLAFRSWLIAVISRDSWNAPLISFSKARTSLRACRQMLRSWLKYIKKSSMSLRTILPSMTYKIIVADFSFIFFFYQELAFSMFSLGRNLKRSFFFSFLFFSLVSLPPHTMSFYSPLLMEHSLTFCWFFFSYLHLTAWWLCWLYGARRRFDGISGPYSL